MAQLLLLRARGRDADDLDDREVLAVAVAAAVVALRLVGEAVDLGTPSGADDARLHHRAVELGRRGVHGVAVDDEHGRELDLAASSRPRRSTSSCSPASTLYCLPP